MLYLYISSGHVHLKGSTGQPGSMGLQGIKGAKV